MATATFAVPSASAAPGDPIQFVVKADSERSLRWSVAGLGAYVAGPVDGAEDLYLVQRSTSRWHSESRIASDTERLGDSLNTRWGVEWAVPAESTVQASPFYAWPFYAWEGGNRGPYGQGYDLGQFLDLDAAHDQSTGAGTLVAVIDTGFDTSHPMLEGHLVPGFDFVDGDNDVTDAANNRDDDGDGDIDEAIGHGTHLAGVIAQVAPDAKILPIRALDADGVGTTYNVVSAVSYALDQGADVINMSLGTTVNEPAMRQVISRAANEGVVVVAAAGNDGSASAQYPARYSSVVGVAAFDPAASSVAQFGTWGSSVDVAALGVAVRSAAPGDEVGPLSGSSVATPVVAGQAALLTQARPFWNGARITEQIRATSSQSLFDSRPTRHGVANVNQSLRSSTTFNPLGLRSANLHLLLSGQSLSYELEAATEPTGTSCRSFFFGLFGSRC